MTLDQFEQLIEAGAFHPRSAARVELIYGQMVVASSLEREAEHAICRLANQWL